MIGVRGNALEWATLLAGGIPDHFVPDGPIAPGGSLTVSYDAGAAHDQHPGRSPRMTAPPPQGHMYLFDSATPPLEDGSYRLTAETDVTYRSTRARATRHSSYFDVVGPRFSVPPAMVAATFPPTNAHGSFQDELPHIVLVAPHAAVGARA